MNHSSPTDASRLAAPDAADLLLALLILLPALVLAWPEPNPLAGDFLTGELSGTGIAMLFSLPATALVAWRRPRPFRGLALFLLAALVLSLASGTTESLQSDRVWIGLSTGLVLALGAGSLGENGRRRLARGAAVISLLLVVPALVGSTPGWGGILGNSGELSGAALPGALCGALLWAREKGRWSWVGLVAVGLFGVHAMRAPVLASLVVLAAVTGTALIVGWRMLGPLARARLASLLLLLLLGFAWVRWSSPAAPPPTLPAQAAAATDEPGPTTTGGFEVRYRIWKATVAMLREHPVVGVGAGQFSTAFPPYRDPQEIELSNWQRRIEQNTEVEHPHNDWLAFLAEAGVAGGALWLGFLLLVAWLALRALRSGSPTSAALAAGALGTLIGAFFNAPLSFNPPAAALSFALFGAVLTRGPDAFAVSVGWTRLRWIGPVAALVLLLHAPRAWAMWSLGSSMTEFGETRSATAKEIAVEEALEACPDSVMALSLSARFQQKHGDLEAALDSWELVLALRPNRFEALLQRGWLLANLGRFVDASEAFDRALKLDAGHPGLLRNRANCYADRGLVEEAMAEIDRLEELGHYQPVWLLDVGCKLILRGKDREGVPLLARADSRFADLSGERAFELDREYRVGGSHLAADAFIALAHLLWARDHAAQEHWDDARRSYRQALRVTRDYVQPTGPLRNRMEFAAVLWRCRQPEDAQAALEGLEPKLSDWAAMPVWAGEALLEMGFGVDR